MTYALVTNLNISYQPRENIKTFIESNLTDKTIKIYSYFPDVKSATFAGFPFIVIPDASEDPEDYMMGTSVTRSLSILDGMIYHDKKKLGDNKLRTIKQDLLKINTTANQKVLRGYGLDEVKLSFDATPEFLPVEHNKAIMPVGFTIELKTEVNHG